MESGGLAMTVTAKRLEEISYEFRHDASDTELTVTTQSLRDVSDHMRFQATEIERLTRELSIAKGGYQDPQFHDAVVISKARVTQFENEIERLTRERDAAILSTTPLPTDMQDLYNSCVAEKNRADAAEARLAALSAPVGDAEIERLTRERDEAERIAAVRLQSIQKHADKHAEAVACAEAAEARLAALSAPVGNDRIRQTISILESAADGLRSPGSRIWIDDVALDVRRLASSLARVRACLVYYADPFSQRDEDGSKISVPDFYSELCFGEYAANVLATLNQPEKADENADA